MLKVLIVCTNADEAGAPRHVEALINELRGMVQYFAVFGEDGPVAKRVRASGIDTYIISSLRSSISLHDDFQSIRSVRRICQDCKPDLIHCHSSKAGMIGRIVAALAGLPWIYTVHGWGWRGLRPLAATIVWFVEFILRFVGSGKYIYVARAVKKSGMRALLLAENAGVVIYNGVNDHQGDVREEPRFAEYGILMAARVSPSKDYMLLFRAFERANICSARLVICGNGTLDPKFIAAAKALTPRSFDRITFHGERSDMLAYFKKTSVVALISNYEALPLSIIEAMSFSKAVIATDVGGVPELIENNISGLLIPRGDESALVNALKAYRSPGLRVAHGVAGRRVFNMQFSSAAMGASVFGIYRLLSK
jgi:glycosyltransferase involved in cell wall biosynthesis